MALSSGPPVDLIMNLHHTSARSPHRSPPARSRYLFRNVQRERDGASDGERVRDMKGPARRLPGGAGVHGVAGMLILLG